MYTTEKKYFVVGGEYEDITFTNLLTEEHHGPFSYKKAYEIWLSRSWATVDNCHNRYKIVEALGEEIAA